MKRTTTDSAGADPTAHAAAAAATAAVGKQAIDHQAIEQAMDEDRCRVAGGLIHGGLPELRPMLTAARRERLQEALVTGGHRSVRSRRRRVLIPALAVAALAGVGMIWLRVRPLGFEVEGGAAGAAGWVETGAGQRAQVRFSDGTTIAIAAASAGRISARTAAGATFTLDRGRAGFDVIHRARSRWLVEAGPFEIVVTGTRFDVEWSSERGHALAIELRAGAVVVRGALAGAGVPLRAGQRLVANLDRGSLVVVDSGDAMGAAGVPDSVRASQAAGPHEPQPPQPGKEAAQNGTEDRVEVPAAATAPHGDRTRAARATGPGGESAEPAVAATPASPTPTPAELVVDPLPPAVGDVQPEPWHPPPFPGDSKLAAGGAACLGWAPQVRFDRSIEGATVASAFSLAFSHPVLDRGRSWCGAGSLRFDARFDLSGAPNRFGDRPHHAGEALVELPAPVDLTGKTVTVRFFVEGPTEIRFGAQLFAVHRPSPDDAKWVGGGFTPNLTTGRWWTLTHTFERENRLFEGGSSPVDRVEKLTLQIYAIGKDRVWTGRVFVDDLGWQ